MVSPMRSSLFLGAALAALTSGCAMTIPETVPYPPAPSAADPAPGGSLCTRTAIAAHSLSGAQAAGGWTLGAIGVAATGTGTIATVVNDQQPRLMAAAGLTLGGVALGIVAYHLFLRSAASARLAETADLALIEKNDRRAWETCVRAKAAWEASKTDPDGITREIAAQTERENRKLRDEIEQLKKSAPPAADPADRLRLAPVPPEPTPLGPRH
jgi:hypothetical protein